MTLTERLLYLAYYGAARRPARWLLRKWMVRFNTIPFGLMRGLIMVGERLDCRMGIYELHVQETMARHVGRNHIVYDVGANIGFHTLLASRLVEAVGRVVAFEPLSQNLATLRRLLAMNDCSNTVCREEAVSVNRGTVTLYASPSPAQASLRPAHGEAHQVRAVTLDDVAAEMPAPNFVLMDIEGGEVDALDGAAELLHSAQGPKLLIEVHSEEMFTLVKQRLRDAGYPFEMIRPPLSRRGLYPIHVFAEKKHAESARRMTSVAESSILASAKQRNEV